MPRRRTEPTASSQLGPWTDADTAMHVVGTSLGVFSALDPDAVLSDETPLRNALFDILLDLVEGGALEMRPADDGRYAFRWRADYATAGLTGDNAPDLDIDPPSPYMAELTRLRRDRDDALGRADFAEALAEERERLLRLANVPVPATRVSEQEARPPVPGLDAEGQSVLDVLYASRREEAPRPDATPAAPDDAPAPTVVADAADDTIEVEPSEPDHPVSEVVYLPPPTPAPDDAQPDGPKWSGYTLDRPRGYLSTVEQLADEG